MNDKRGNDGEDNEANEWSVREKLFYFYFRNWTGFETFIFRHYYKIPGKGNVLFCTDWIRFALPDLCFMFRHFALFIFLHFVGNWIPFRSKSPDHSWRKALTIRFQFFLTSNQLASFAKKERQSFDVSSVLYDGSIKTSRQAPRFPTTRHRLVRIDTILVGPDTFFFLKSLSFLSIRVRSRPYTNVGSSSCCGVFFRSGIEETNAVINQMLHCRGHNDAHTMSGLRFIV